jgi:thiosulfate reductase/polysulfide reductase chain A
MQSHKKITRRSFLKTTALGTAALSISPALLKELKATPVKPVEQDFFEKYEKGKWTYNYCNMCFWTCGIKVKTVKGVVKKIEGIPNHPLNDGKICAKGNSGIAALYDENRLKYPLIRTGEKGSNKWKKASWEEAFNYIAERLKPLVEKEPEKIHLTSHGHGGAHFKYLLRAMGSRNVYAASWTQ